MLLVGVVRIRDDGISTLGDVLVGASRGLLELPLKLVQVLEVLVAPLGGCAGPSDLQAGCDCVGTLAGTVSVLPAEALVGKVGTVGVCASVLGGSSTVCLSEGVATNDQGSGLLVVHSHAAEGCADVVGSGNGVRDSVRTLGVDVDQTHVCGSERLLEVAL